MRFHGHVVVVTGAGRGIGAATARAFAAEGARLAVLDIDAAGLDALVQDLTAKGTDVLGLRCDVTVGAEVRQAFEAAVPNPWLRVGDGRGHSCFGSDRHCVRGLYCGGRAALA
jgi:NAD(P)-dependent dehydrogenase (short-subunit alcohol dehydrogenase family)